VGEVDEVVFGQPDLVERGWPGREGLSRRCLFARDRRLGHLALDDIPQRFAGYAVEDETHRLFGCLHDRFDRFAINDDVEQNGCCRNIVVEYIVMTDLKMPDALTRTGIQTNQRSAVKVVAGAVPSVVVVVGDAKRQVHIPEFVIRAHDRP